MALVGHPKCGKSTIAQMLEQEFNGIIIDDGEPLRRALPHLTNIDGDLCYSQEGKASSFRLGDRIDTVREALGELGNWLEGRYGEDVIPELAIARAETLSPIYKLFIYPSVRKTQGRVYRRHGGIVIQIDSPQAGPSGNAFDTWDESQVDLRITNDQAEMGLDELREYVTRIPELISAL